MVYIFKNITSAVYFIFHYIPVKNRYPYSRRNKNNNHGINGQCYHSIIIIIIKDKQNKNRKHYSCKAVK